MADYATGSGQTTSSQVAPLPREIYDRTLLERALPYLPHALFGQRIPIDVNSGDQPTFTRFNSLPLGVLLAEGVNPDPYRLERTQVAGQLKTWGAYVEITDWINYTVQDKLLTQTAKLLGENAGETLDEFYRDQLVQGSSIYYADGESAKTNVDTEIAQADLDAVILALQNAKAKYFDEMINPTTGVGTIPIPDSFFAITDFNVAQDLYQNITEANGFIPVHKYSSQVKTLKNEFGSYAGGGGAGIRFIASTKSKVTLEGGKAVSTSGCAGTTNCDVHTILVFGRDAYGITPLGSGKALENIVKSAREAGGALNQFSTSGWKAVTDCLILQEAFMYRIETGVKE